MTPEPPPKLTVLHLSTGQYIIPSAFTGYGNTFEINGQIVHSPGYSDISCDEIKTLRRVTKTSVVVAHVNGEGDRIPEKEYAEKLAYLREHRKENGERYEDDTCIPVYTWDDKKAQFEEYILTTTYSSVTEDVFTFGDYIEFEIIDVPKSDYSFITPLWNVSNKITPLFAFNIRPFYDSTIKECKAKYPNVKMTTYEHSYTMFGEKSNHYQPINEFYERGGIYRGTYAECISTMEKFKSEIERCFEIENGSDTILPKNRCPEIVSSLKTIYSLVFDIKSSGKTYTKRSDALEMISTLMKDVENIAAEHGKVK